MIACLDVQYSDAAACAAAVAFETWSSPAPSNEYAILLN